MWEYKKIETKARFTQKCLSLAVKCIPAHSSLIQNHLLQHQGSRFVSRTTKQSWQHLFFKLNSPESWKDFTFLHRAASSHSTMSVLKDFFCDNDPTHLTVIYIVCSSSLLLSVLPSSLSSTFISRRENNLCINESAAVLRSSKPSPAMTNWLPRKLGGCQPGRTCSTSGYHTHTHTCTHSATLLSLFLTSCHI